MRNRDEDRPHDRIVVYTNAMTGKHTPWRVGTRIGFEWHDVLTDYGWDDCRLASREHVRWFNSADDASRAAAECRKGARHA